MTLKSGSLRSGLRNVSTGVAAIPDSELDHRWLMDEGSGTSLADSIGSVSASLIGATWTSDQKYTKNQATSYDGTDDHWETESAFGVNGSEFTVMFWLDSATPSDGYAGIIKSADGTLAPDNGFELLFEDTNPDSYWYRHRSNGDSDYIYQGSGPDASNQDLFFALTASGDDGRLRIWDTDAKQLDESGTATRGTGDSALSGMVGDNGDYSEGIKDDVMVNTQTVLAESTIEDIWQETMR